MSDGEDQIKKKVIIHVKNSYSDLFSPTLQATYTASSFWPSLMLIFYIPNNKICLSEIP